MGECLIIECGTPNKLKFKPLFQNSLQSKTYRIETITMIICLDTVKTFQHMTHFMKEC